MSDRQPVDPISERLRSYSSAPAPSRSSAPAGGGDSPYGAASVPGAAIGGVNMARKIGGKISDLAGVEKFEGFDFREFVSDIFRRHPVEEVEASFTVGTPGTIPSMGAVDTSWPRPWLFTRLLAGSGLLYFLFNCALDWFSNTNLVPGLIAAGTVAIPFSTLIFFFEMNARRNISLYQILRFVMFGGIISLIVSLFLFDLPMMKSMSWLGASIAGIVEETGKLAAVVLVADTVRYRYKLNGLLFGAAVGTGFAVFESMGYAFNALLSNGLSAMTSTILLRGVLSPFGHIAWTAIAAAALWRVMNGSKFEFRYLRDIRFLRLFCVPVLLHMIWNSDFQLPFMAKYIALGVVVWLIVLALIQEGLKELRREKAG